MSYQPSISYYITNAGKEYVYTIDRLGRGTCCCRTDAWYHLSLEFRYAGYFLLHGSPIVVRRFKDLEHEFSWDIKLSQRLTAMIWLSHDEYEAMGEDQPLMLALARESKIDRELRQFVPK